MPRVSPEHLDARRTQILDAARRCFIRGGFHATSMQEILAEAGLSPGALYRYFPSKDAIILAIARGAVAELTSAFAATFDEESPPPLDEALDGIFVELERLCAERDLGKLAVLVWGEAVSDAGMAEPIGATLGEAREFFTRLAHVYQERGDLRRDVPAGSIGRVLGGLVPGFMVQHAVIGGVDARGYAEGLRALIQAPDREGARA